LVEAWRRFAGVRLLHVGAVSDCELPTNPLFQHIDKVDQLELPKYYAMAHVFALASYEEGFATVQFQALASGLKLVCTDRCGGEDLIPYVARPDDIRVVPSGDVDRMATALQLSLDSAIAETGPRDRFGANRPQISWQAYAERYERNLLERL